MGRFVSMHDFVQAHVAIFSTVAGYFVIVFLASQFISCLEFTGILTLLGDDGTVLHILRVFLYDFPLVLYILLSL
jgi:p-aminobenzoyl-glutamate transporter AbgT